MRDGIRTCLKRHAFPVISGAALAISFPTWSAYPLAWVALTPLFWRASSLGPRQAFLLFSVAGLVFNSIVLHWLMTNVYWAGGWAFWGYQGLCVLLALLWGLVGLMWTWVRLRGPRLGGAICLALLWTTMEFVQAHLFTGFGWGALGYSQGNDLALVQWAALGGVSCVSAILVLVNALVALAIAERGPWRLVRVLAAVVVLIISHGVGALLLGPADYDSMPLNVGIIQPDFPLEMKWDYEYTEEMVRNMAQKSRWLAQHEPVDLFVWPESAVMVDLASSPDVQAQVVSLTQDTGCALYAGGQRVNEKTGGYPNSSYYIDANGDLVACYDKIHLAPFGEYVPFANHLPFLRRVVPGTGDIEPGSELKTMPINDRRFGPLICFEVLFADLAERLRAKGADVLVVITNLGWFGASSAIPQEFELARLRAIETRLPLVHCANTGVSGVFDPWGRFRAVNAAFQRSGRYIPFPKNYPPARTIMRRCVGAFPVAAPGKRPVPSGPAVFPWIVLAATLVIVFATLLRPLKNAPAATAAK